MWQRKASGSYYEIGQQIGRLMRAQNFSGFTGEHIPFLKQEGKREFAEQCREAVRVHAPDLLDELQGILDGGRFEFETLGVLELSLSALAGCTLFAIAGEHTAEGVPVLARSYDFYDWSVPGLTGTWTSPDDRLSSLGFTDIGLGRYGGANEAGLAIATTAVNPEGASPGVINYLATRWVLDNCRTVAEAVAFLKGTPKVWGVNCLMIDGESDIAIVESHPERTHVSHPEGGFAVVTNHFISAEMGDFQRQVHPDSVTRLEAMERWFEDRDGPITLDDIKEVQRDHESGMCVHYADDRISFCTCWAWVAQATARRIHVCQGSPCENEYEVHGF
jgi:predicted choloylglycine hydrolase